MKRYSKNIMLAVILMLSIIINSVGFDYTVVDAGNYGWIEKSGYTYYYNKSGEMVTGLTNINMDTYYFMKKDIGSMKKGSLVRGWKKLGNNYYFFSRQTGAMVTGEKVDGIVLKDNGKARITTGVEQSIKSMISARTLVNSITNPSDSKNIKKEKCKVYLEDIDGLKKSLDKLSIKYKEKNLEDEEKVEVLTDEVFDLMVTECGFDSASYSVVNKKSANVSKVRLKKSILYENGDIKVRWTKSENADYYLLYKKSAGETGYALIKKLTKRAYKDTKTKAGKKYFYRVIAVKNETALTKRTKSAYSSTKKCRARKKPGKIAYLGDSVMSGFDVYGVLSQGEKSYAEVGQSINTLNSSGMSDVLSYNPDRVFIMSGTNDCVGDRTDAQLQSDIDSYISVCKKLYNKNNKVEIIAMGIGPTNSDRVPMSNVNRYNSYLKSAAAKLNYVHFFDTASYLKDSTGHIASSYSGGDGIHWTGSAYTLIYGKLKDFVKHWKG